MQRRIVKDLILRHLAKGPLYVGAIPLFVGCSDREARAALAELAAEARVVRDAEGTVRLA